MRNFMILSLILMASCSSYNPANYDQYVSHAVKLHEEGEWSESIDTIEIIGKHSYLSDDLIILRSRNLRQTGRYDEGISKLITESENRPHSELLILELAQWYLDSEQNLLAKIILEKLFDQGNPSTKTRKLYGYSLLKSEQWQKAESVLNPLNNTEDFEAIFWSAQALFKMQYYKSAIPLFVKTYESPEFAQRSAEYLAWIFTENNDVNEANRFIRHLVLKNPENSYAQKMLMRNIMNMHQPDKVTMLKLYNEKYQEEWSRYAYFNELRNAGQKKEALDYLSSIWNQEPGTLWAATNYSNELLRNGDIEQARNILTRSKAASSPDDVPYIDRQLAALEHPVTDQTPRGIASISQTYTVKKGDSLHRISSKFFNTTQYWNEIYKANEKQLKNPEQLQEGMLLNIPEVNL